MSRVREEIQPTARVGRNMIELMSEVGERASDLGTWPLGKGSEQQWLSFDYILLLCFKNGQVAPL